MGNYECLICGRSKVKLWRPEDGNYPLLCAKCAEYMQTYTNCSINKDGEIPLADGSMTSSLIVDLSDISQKYRSGNTKMIPAILPNEGINWWRNLPNI